MSVLYRRVCVLVCSLRAFLMPVLILVLIPAVSQSAEKNSVGLEQMRLASAVGARCSGFYDGVYALLHNMEKEGDEASLTVINSNWPGLNKRYVFRQSTSAMLLTDIFIRQMNQTFEPKQLFSLQSFAEDYVNSRKAAMAWTNQSVMIDIQKQQREQCEHILQITKRNGTLRDDMINNAMQKRSVALGVDLKMME